jgi:hypothetical protein
MPVVVRSRRFSLRKVRLALLVDRDLEDSERYRDSGADAIISLAR